VLIVLLGWGYVVLMMALAEASGPHGSLLGALVTLLLYGVLPLSVLLYIGGTRARWQARRRAEAAERAAAGSGDVDPGGGGQAAGDAVAPIREES
jgi:4-amino-4-deoxy-L-arabinose transferase-like glycosyltransferase